MKKILFFIAISLYGHNFCSDLINAASQGDNETVELLLNARANINAQDQSGRTALMHATYDGYIHIVKSLLKRNANVNIQNASNSTALMLAASNNYTQIVKLLLDVLEINVTLTNYKGQTALQIAKNLETKEIAELIEVRQKYQDEYLSYCNNDNHIYDAPTLNNIANQIPKLPIDLIGIVNGYAGYKLKFSEYLNKKQEEQKVIENN